MAQTYTPDEAAEKLGISVRELKKKINTDPDWKHIRPVMDGSSSPPYRASEIDAMVGKMAVAKPVPPPAPPTLTLDDPLDFGSLDLPAYSTAGDDDIMLTEPASKPGSRSPSLPKSGKFKAPAAAHEEDDDDIFSAPAQIDPNSGPRTSKQSGKSNPPKSGVRGASGSSLRLPRPAAPPDESSEFDLSINFDDDAISLAGPSSDATGRSGNSGILSRKPSDSGVLLGGKSKGDNAPLSFAGLTKGTGRPPSKPVVEEDEEGSSEFDLNLADSNELEFDLEAAPQPAGDIFETNFGAPEAEGGSHELVIDEDTDLDNSSEFDLALSDADASAEEESASEVVAYEDDDSGIDVNYDDLEDSGSASAVLRNARPDLDVELDEDEDERVGVKVVAGNAPWGVVPFLMLAPTVMLMAVAAMISYELVHGMWGYEQGVRPSSMVVRTIAGWFSNDLPKE